MDNGQHSDCYWTHLELSTETITVKDAAGRNITEIGRMLSFYL